MGDKAEKDVKKKKVEDPKKPPEKPNKLQEAQIIVGESQTAYVVESVLGKGGFGEVYKVHPRDDPEQKFALKVEDNQTNDPSKKNMLRLKVEILVFETIEAAREANIINTVHFVNMVDKGKTADFKYYVMDIIWLSLREVCKDQCNGKLSPSTLIQIARQTLRGVESFHELGFLHRDIKPANYAVGLAPRDNMIYLLDFGISRPYREKDGRVMIARKKVPFLGTLKFASVRCWEQQEQARRDDLEVWFYMMMELYDKKNLSWWNISDKKEIQKRKLELVEGSHTMHKDGKLKCPVHYCDIINSIYKLKYEDPGDYRFINECFAKIVKEGKIDESLPLDWIGKAPKGPPIKPRKKKPKPRENRVSKMQSVMAGPQQQPLQKELTPQQKEKRRRRKEREARRAEEEHIRIEMDEENSDEEDSNEEEDDYRGGGGGRRRKKSRKRRSRDRERTRENEDFSDRDDREDRRDDRRDDRRGGRRRRSSTPGGARKRASRMSRVSKKTRGEDSRDDQERIARIPEPYDEMLMDKYQKDSDEDEDDRRDAEKRTPENPRNARDAKKANQKRDEPKKKEEKTPEKDSRQTPAPADDGAYMVLGDINNKEKDQNVKDKKDKEKKEGEAKKEQAGPAMKLLDLKKATDAAAPVKKDAADNKKK